jgi:Protein of unknown function (DUF1579)
MQMPSPTAEHERLGLLAGDWEGDERILPTPFDPEGGPARGAWSARLALGGFCLIADYRQRRGGEVNFEGHGVYGWDPRGRCYTLHWFDSTGIEHGEPAFGAWDGDRLTLMHETTHAGHSRHVYEVTGDRFRFSLEHSPDGVEWMPFLQGEYEKTSPTG